MSKAEAIICPLCGASFLMQRETNTLAHVVLMLLNMWFHLFGVYENTIHMEYKLMSDLERRWKAVEEPLYFLAFALHPYYQRAASEIIAYSEEINGGWVNNGNYLSVARLTEASKFYYGKFKLSERKHHWIVQSMLGN